LIKVTYNLGVLTVETDLDGDGQNWAQCLSVNAQLPTGYYFGFSAETGQLADNHDLYGFNVRNLDQNARSLDNARVRIMLFFFFWGISHFCSAMDLLTKLRSLLFFAELILA